MGILNLDSVIEVGSRNIKGKTVQQIINNDRHLVFEMIKKYNLEFSDEVLKEAHVTKTIRDKKAYQEELHIPRDKDTTGSTKKLKKENKDIDEILDELMDKYSSSSSKDSDYIKSPEMSLE